MNKLKLNTIIGLKIYRRFAKKSPHVSKLLA
jgi:hypothetical protein